MSFHQEALTPTQSRVLQQLGRAMTQRRFYMGGGTAVALHLGHRRSADLDWFTAEGLEDPLRLAQEIRDEGVRLTTAQVGRGTLHGVVSGVRVTFLEYIYPLLEPPVPWADRGCLLASLDDLACMKLAAVTQRGAKKDFVDVYALGRRHRPLAEMLRLYQKKYSVADIGHVLYGLVYFEEADSERMPRLLWDANWRTIKRTIQAWVREVAG